MKRLLEFAKQMRKEASLQINDDTSHGVFIGIDRIVRLIERQIESQSQDNKLVEAINKLIEHHEGYETDSALRMGRGNIRELFVKQLKQVLTEAKEQNDES